MGRPVKGFIAYQKGEFSVPNKKSEFLEPLCASEFSEAPTETDATSGISDDFATSTRSARAREAQAVVPLDLSNSLLAITPAGVLSIAAASLWGDPTPYELTFDKDAAAALVELMVDAAAQAGMVDWQIQETRLATQTGADRFKAATRIVRHLSGRRITELMAHIAATRQGQDG